LLVTGELLEHTRERRAQCRSDSKRESTARRTGVGDATRGKIVVIRAIGRRIARPVDFSEDYKSVGFGKTAFQNGHCRPVAHTTE
jgi:hypothetical protein